MAEKDDLEAVISEVEKKYPNLIANITESARNTIGKPVRLVLVLTPEMTPEEIEMRCYEYYLKKGCSPAQAEQEAKELLLVVDGMGEICH